MKISSILFLVAIAATLLESGDEPAEGYDIASYDKGFADGQRSNRKTEATREKGRVNVS